MPIICGNKTLLILKVQKIRFKVYFLKSNLTKDEVSAQIFHGEDDCLVRVAAVGVHVALLDAVYLLQRYHQAEI
jgi:hypothetical protein